MVGHCTGEEGMQLYSLGGNQGDALRLGPISSPTNHFFAISDISNSTTTQKPEIPKASQQMFLAQSMY